MQLLSLVHRSISFLALGALMACAVERSTFAPVSSDGIVGGANAEAGKGDLVSVVAIMGLNTGSLCTGTLIGANTVLSAAHCFSDRTDEYAVFFQTSIDGEGTPASVDLIAVHSQYGETLERDENDIALVHFRGAAPKGFKSATLLTDQSLLKNGASVLLAGYGITDANKSDSSGRLHSVVVPVKDVAFGRHEVTVDQAGGRGACHGDSGGPAFLKSANGQLLWGVTSRGRRTSGRDLCNQLGVYTNAATYLDWIRVNQAALSKRGEGASFATVFGPGKAKNK